VPLQARKPLQHPQRLLQPQLKHQHLQHLQKQQPQQPQQARVEQLPSTTNAEAHRGLDLERALLELPAPFKTLSTPNVCK